MATDFGRPHSSIRFSTLQPMATSVFCAARPLAWSLSPSIVLQRKKAFSTVPCQIPSRTPDTESHTNRRFSRKKCRSTPGPHARVRYRVAHQPAFFPKEVPQHARPSRSDVGLHRDWCGTFARKNRGWCATPYPARTSGFTEIGAAPLRGRIAGGVRLRIPCDSVSRLRIPPATPYPADQGCVESTSISTSFLRRNGSVKGGS
ncbi:MAG: hypothetical protein ACI8QS_000456 [Planctomycetota bacterium]|jgi:hypothetical protein